MLLISNNQPQMVILDPLLNQGMGPNDHIHLSQLNSSQGRPPNCHLHPTGQQGNRKLWKKLTQTFIMLFCQNLRWYHQSRLITCCMGCIHGQASNNRLPRPNIPLQKAIHVTRRGHIWQNFPQTPLLSLSQNKGQLLDFIRQGTTIKSNGNPRIHPAIFRLQTL